MRAHGHRLGRNSRLAVLALLLVAAQTLLGPTSSAQESAGGVRDASRHFERAVALYAEADYRGALVEFKRAFAIAPNTAVLYNVGEAEYQLKDYASALKTFERFLADADPADSRRPGIMANLEMLRARVGRLRIITVPSGADVTLDDESVGKTPFASELLVSIGHRKIVASAAGHSPVTRYVDVAADDNVAVALQLPGGAPEPNPSTPETVAAAGGSSASGGGAKLRALGWVATTGLTAGAVTFGLLAMKASNDLKAARNAFPTSSATLIRDGNMTTTYAVLCDSLAAAAIVVGGITLYSTLSSPVARASTAANVRLELGPSSARFEMTF